MQVAGKKSPVQGLDSSNMFMYDHITLSTVQSERAIDINSTSCLVFSHYGFWSGNFFLIAPFPDHCLLVPFYVVQEN